jgi:hypothetical protein
LAPKGNTPNHNFIHKSGASTNFGRHSTTSFRLSTPPKAGFTSNPSSEPQIAIKCWQMTGRRKQARGRNKEKSQRRKETKMKTLKTLIMAGALAAGITGTAYAQPEPMAPPTKPNVPHKHFAKVLGDVLAKYDANKDAQLDAKEFAALAKDIEEGNVPPSDPPAPPRAPRLADRNERPQADKATVCHCRCNQERRGDRSERDALRPHAKGNDTEMQAPGERGPRHEARASATEMNKNRDIKRDRAWDQDERDDQRPAKLDAGDDNVGPRHRRHNPENA